VDDERAVGVGAGQFGMHVRLGVGHVVVDEVDGRIGDRVLGRPATCPLSRGIT
jgi:hypothetical protein